MILPQDKKKKTREINFSRTFLKFLILCAHLNVTYSMHTCSRSNSKIVSTSCLHKYCCVALSCAPDRAKMPVICCPNPSKVLLLHRRETVAWNCRLALWSEDLKSRGRGTCVVLSAPPTICSIVLSLKSARAVPQHNNIPTVLLYICVTWIFSVKSFDY